MRSSLKVGVQGQRLRSIVCRIAVDIRGSACGKRQLITLRFRARRTMTDPLTAQNRTRPPEYMYRYQPSTCKNDIPWSHLHAIKGTKCSLTFSLFIRCNGCEVVLKSIETQVNKANTNKESSLKIQQGVEHEVRLVSFLFNSILLEIPSKEPDFIGPEKKRKNHYQFVLPRISCRYSVKMSGKCRNMKVGLWSTHEASNVVSYALKALKNRIGFKE